VANHAAGVLRWKRIEIDATRLVLSGVALALPLVIGVLTGHTAAGLTAVMGALLISSAGHEGGRRERLTDLGVTGLVGVAVVWLGAVAGNQPAVSGYYIVAVGFVAALLGGIGTLEAKAAAQAVVFSVIGAHLGTGPVSANRLTGYVLLGMLTGAALTLGSFEVSRLLSPLWRRGLDDDLPPPAPPKRGDLAKWRASLHQFSGWRYPVRLALCLAVAEAVAHLRPGQHSYWIALTVSLVVLREEAASVGRAVERGLGTSIGVLVGGLLLGRLAAWGMVAVVAVIGALRPHLKLANYTAYAALMTPLVVMLNEFGADMSGAVLRERVVDTLIGCLIGVVVGYLPWRGDRGSVTR
jgi:hypothetical protein